LTEHRIGGVDHQTIFSCAIEEAVAVNRCVVTGLTHGAGSVLVDGQTVRVKIFTAKVAD
jgi:hypothetical protein